MSTFAQTVKAYERPEVQDYLAALQDKKRRDAHAKGSKLPLTAAGMLGAGMGLTWIGDRALTADDRAKLDNLNSLTSRMDAANLKGHQSNQFAGTPQMFYDYVDRASQAASAKLFGHSAPEVITMLRKSPLLRGTSFDLAKADKFELGQSEEHYGDFLAGPLAAYIHQLKKHDATFGRSWAATQTYIDPNTNKGRDVLQKMLDTADKIPLLSSAKKNITDAYQRKWQEAGEMTRPTLPDLVTPGGGNENMATALVQNFRKNTGNSDTYHEFIKSLTNHYNQFLKEEGVASDGKGVERVRQISESLPHGKEMDLVRKFKGWASVKDPSFGKTLDKVEAQMAEGMAGPSRMYSAGGTTVARLFQDLPRAAGAALVAGGLGLGGWWAYAKLREHQLKKKLREKARAARRSLEPENTVKAANENTTSDNLLASLCLPEISKSEKRAYAQAMNVQTMLPLSNRRQLSEAEKLQVALGRDQWIPKIFDNFSDSPAVRLASPSRQAALWGVGVGLPAALIAAANSGSPTSGLVTGLGAGGLAAVLAALHRQKSNADIEEVMRRLPEGSTLRDFDADPLMAERRRFAHERSLMAGHGAGNYGAVRFGLA